MTHLQTPSHVAVRPACSGLWSLAAGRTVAMRPRVASTLKLVCGRAWVTTDAPLDGSARRFGDHVLTPGDSLPVAPGDRLVIEAWGDDAVRFDWLTDAAPVAQTPTRWQAEVAAPSRELGRALGGTAAALGRLVWGLAGYAAHLAGFLVAGRGRELSRFESNWP